MKIRTLKMPERRIVISEKMQLYLQYQDHIDYLNMMIAAQQDYFKARDAHSINRITTLEMETIVRNGLVLATKGEAFRELKKELATELSKTRKALK